MRLIDADALIESIKNTADLGGWIGAAVYHIKQVAIKYIDDAPSINIVRCKECKHWWNEYGDSACMLHSDFTVNADDFCSYGEREGE